MIARFLCRLFDHRWSVPFSIGDWPMEFDDEGVLVEDHGLPLIGFAPRTEHLYRTTCRRQCGAVIEGDWRAMEAVGAWPHYRTW